jgi:uncharacterized protein
MAMKTIDSRRFGPWAVVTGASSGIGAAFAHALARHGFNLVLVARRVAALEELGAVLQRTHEVQCRPIALDLADGAFLMALRGVTDPLEIGLVVSNAGCATATELVHWGSAELERDMAVNVVAHAKLSHHFGGRFVQLGRGGILLVSSIAGNQPVPYLASYSASKSFVTVFGESLHHELRPRGVTVTVLVAGPTDTRMRTSMGFGRSRVRPMTPEQCALEGLGALARGKAAYVPGARTRLLLGLLPRWVITRVLGRMTAAFARRPGLAGHSPPGRLLTSGRAAPASEETRT